MTQYRMQGIETGGMILPLAAKASQSIIVKAAVINRPEPKQLSSIV